MEFNSSEIEFGSGWCRADWIGIYLEFSMTAWAINRVLDLMTTTMLENWIPTTDLPRLMGLEIADLTRNSFLTAMDFVCYDDKTVGQIRDFTQAIDDALYQQWRKMHPLKPGETETVAYDLTSVLFFGISCSLAEFGYNAKHVKRFQVNLAILVSKLDKYPIAHFVYNGSRNGYQPSGILLHDSKIPINSGGVVAVERDTELRGARIYQNYFSRSKH